MVSIHKTDSITPFQLILIATTTIGLNNHVFAVSPLIREVGRDSWMTVIITMLLMMLWIPLLIYIHKKTNRQPLFEWLKESIGKTATNILTFIFISYLIVMAGFTLRETITWISILFLPETPVFLITFLFIFTCWQLAITSLRTLNILNIFLLFFITILGFFVSFANIEHKNFMLLLPLLEHGYQPVLSGTIYQAAGISEIFIFLLLQHKVQKPLNWRHFVSIILILTILTIGPLIGAIIEFGPTEASIQRFPPYEEWGLVSLGNFVEHVDFLSIYQWLAGAFIRLALLLLLMKEILPSKADKVKNKYLFGFSLIIAGIVLAPISDFRFSYLTANIILPGTFLFFFSFSLLISVLVIISSRKKRGASYEI
ncbi:endospore germination permease [Peribacillus asahii]|uniref:endospore germination permease n=1 Tax=Peribacillus asahii TaxID=228899 RepID=UPI001FE5D0E8|nr:endospore germination permease [Peribacillus asahii]